MVAVPTIHALYMQLPDLVPCPVHDNIGDGEKGHQPTPSPVGKFTYFQPIQAGFFSQSRQVTGSYAVIPLNKIDLEKAGYILQADIFEYCRLFNY